ncbi:glycosyltransferase family 1 protein [Photobacterium kishitanii]|uniref:glycosyltransferase n=1 Tax=Photobacterium kishitanii TaxID=318456 RepID=UPI00071AEC80|nr:glycosyltransferase [Photobacterium kishitanii]PSU88814.1 glycosyltransferase family 1 protein [Photobacterium kishitanii]
MTVLFVYCWDGFEDSFLKKDVGLFPEYFSKVCGEPLESVIFRSENNKNYISFVLNFFFFRRLLIRESKYIILFHVSLRTAVLSFLLKLINRKAKIIIKSDISISNIKYFKLREKTLKFKLIRYFNKSVDFFCIETSTAIDELEKNIPDFLGAEKIYLLPNGVDFIDVRDVRKDLKTVTIITRDDSMLKGFDRIPEVLSNITSDSNYKINIIGSLTDKTKEKIIRSNNNLNVVFHDVKNRKEVFEILQESNVFLNFSYEESYCFALIEAAMANCHIITTPVGVSKDLNAVYKKMNVVDYNPEVFYQLLKKTCDNENIENDNVLIKNKYNWFNIVSGFNNYIRGQ